MEYRFRAKKSLGIPNQVISIIYLGFFISWFFPRNEEYRWISISILLVGFITLFFCFRELSQRIILTISEKGITYSGNNYIFAPKLENIDSKQLSKIFIPNNEWLSFIERKFKPTICLINHKGELVTNLDGQQWQSLDNLNLEQALAACFKDHVELANRSKILDIIIKHQKNAMELGKVAGYFAYSTVGLSLICAGLAFLDPYITIAWGQYKYLIWGVALIIATISLMILVRSRTHFMALVVVPFIFTIAMTFLIHQSLMLINYYLGEQASYRFEKLSQNKNYEMWRTATGEAIKCKLSPRKLHDYQTVNVHVGILGVVRVATDEICISSQALK